MKPVRIALIGLRGAGKSALGQRIGEASGLTFVELNDSGEIQYLSEIPEPIYKPGDLIKDLLKAVTSDAEPKSSCE